MQDEEARSLDLVTKYFSINNMRSMTMTKRKLVSSIWCKITCRVNAGSDGNIMPLHSYKNYFLGQQKNKWQQQDIQLTSSKHLKEQQ